VHHQRLQAVKKWEIIASFSKMASKTLTRDSDANVSGEWQTSWIKYKTWSYEKKKKKEKMFLA